VKTFLLRGRTTGALLDTEDERWAAQSLLDYWTSILYRQGEEPPDTTLVEFDPSLAPELPDSLCPYLGLEAFREENHNLFYGRQRLLNKLLKRLQENRFLAVIGSSGSGKSSIVLAGLLPSLKAGKLSESDTWHYYSPIVPGTQPLNNLASIFCPAERDMNTWVHEQIEEFKANPNHLLTLLNERGSQPEVLVIDQFEETFTLCLDNQIRQAFINNLLRVIQSSENSHVVILTMRTDFESRVALYSEFQQEFEKVQVRVISMDARELREAIEKPAELIGLKFEENLTNRLLEDVLGEPAALPLLQFTLLKLWENRERNRVTWETYKSLGGGRLALSRSADKLYNEFIPEDQVTVRRILLKMVQPTEGLEVTSSRISRQSLYEEGEAKDRIDRVLQKLIEARLVKLTERKQSADIQVELAHEALVRNWPRFVEWVADERVNLRNRWQLKSTANQWLELGKNTSVLWRGKLLQDAENYQDLSPLEQDFVQCSLEAQREQALEQYLYNLHQDKSQLYLEVKSEQTKAAQKQLETEREQRKALQKIYRARQGFCIGLTAICVIGCVGISVFAIFANFLKDNSVTLPIDNSVTLPIDNSVANVSAKPDVELMVKSNGKVIRIITSDGTNVSLMPDRKLKNITLKNGTIEIIQVSDKQRIVHPTDFQSIEFSQDGKTITGKDKDGKVQIKKLDNLSNRLLQNRN
jgi:ABC-type proline/glycine betaine transport system ATPase subunit